VPIDLYRMGSGNSPEKLFCCGGFELTRAEVQEIRRERAAAPSFTFALAHQLTDLLNFATHVVPPVTKKTKMAAVRTQPPSRILTRSFASQSQSQPQTVGRTLTLCRQTFKMAT
jgi:hypothetical protein